ncbi:MAG TPA: hypothetical protein VGJ84_03640 [Polyangiaceae bacterium]
MRLLTGNALDSYHTNGFLIVRKLFGSERLAELADIAQRHHQRLLAKGIEGRASLHHSCMEGEHEPELFNCLTIPGILALSEQINRAKLRSTYYEFNRERSPGLDASMFWHRDLQFLRKRLPSWFDVQGWRMQVLSLSHASRICSSEGWARTQAALPGGGIRKDGANVAGTQSKAIIAWRRNGAQRRHDRGCAGLAPQRGRDRFAGSPCRFGVGGRRMSGRGRGRRLGPLRDARRRHAYLASFQKRRHSGARDHRGFLKHRLVGPLGRANPPHQNPVRLRLSQVKQRIATGLRVQPEHAEGPVAVGEDRGGIVAARKSSKEMSTASTTTRIGMSPS